MNIIIIFQCPKQADFIFNKPVLVRVCRHGISQNDGYKCLKTTYLCRFLFKFALTGEIVLFSRADSVLLKTKEQSPCRKFIKK